MSTAESMSIVDGEEAGKAAPFTVEVWLERYRRIVVAKSSASNLWW